MMRINKTETVGVAIARAIAKALAKVPKGDLLDKDDIAYAYERAAEAMRLAIRGHRTAAAAEFEIAAGMMQSGEWDATAAAVSSYAKGEA